MRGLRIFLPPLMTVVFACTFALTLDQVLTKAAIPSTRSFGEHATPKVGTAAKQATEPYSWRKPEELDESLTSASERPLFVETRTNVQFDAEVEALPPRTSLGKNPAKKKVAQPSAPKPPIVKFIGYINSGAKLEALISIGSPEVEKWVAVGDEVEKWKVAKISVLDVHFEFLEHVFVVGIER